MKVKKFKAPKFDKPTIEEIKVKTNEINKRYKFISEEHEKYDDVMCYVHFKVMDSLKRFKPNERFFEDPVRNMHVSLIIFIRCHFHDAKALIYRGHSLERGDCDKCIVKKIQENNTKKT